MELEAHFRSYINALSRELNVAPIGNVRLLNSPTTKKAFVSFGDFCVYMNHPSLAPLKAHVQRIASELPAVSDSWPLQISNVIANADSPYMELYVRRPAAFQCLCRAIDEVYARTTTTMTISRKSSENVRKKRLHLLSAPGQASFDDKKSTLVVNYIQRLSSVADFEVVAHEGREWNADVSTGEEFAKNAYFDTKKGGIDLAKFLADRKLLGKFDSSIGMLYENNAAVKFALTMHQHFFIAPEDLVCHVAPQSKSVLLQQIAVFLMMLGCQANQSFVFHGGISEANLTVEAYEERVGRYISDQLRRKRVAGAELVGKALKDTKLVFDLLGTKQSNRVKVSSILQNSEHNTFEGKGGIFVQYTCSRLAGLLKHYDKAVKSGLYSGCPSSDELQEENLDWTLLSLEHEWTLWKEMLRFVELLKTCMRLYSENEQFSRIDVRAHSICEGLLTLCKEFSIFYSKVRILVESQAHVLSTVRCRIYFIRTLHKLIKCGLTLLGVEAVECM